MLARVVPSRLAVRTARRTCATWRVWTALDERDEGKKVQLASLLHELSSLAAKEMMEDGNRATASSSSSGAAVGAAAASLRVQISPDESDALKLPPSLDGLTPGAAHDSIAALLEGASIGGDSLRRLLLASTEAVRRDPTLIDLSAHDTVHVVGDLHGSLECLGSVLRICDVQSLQQHCEGQRHPDQDQPKRAVVFNGDFVDRGTHSVEVLTALLLLKLAFPEQVYLLRGNHEDAALATVYGFRDEVERQKFEPETGAALWELCVDCFASLPIAARTNSCAIIHGGPPSEEFQLSDLVQISVEERSTVRSSLEVEDQPIAMLLQGLLWSDPSEEDGLRVNDRRGGAGTLFGPDVARRWLQRHGLTTLVRSHQVVEDGWARLDCGEGTEVLTVFSSASYPDGNGMNAGAVIELAHGGEWQPHAFAHEILGGCATASTQRSLLELIVAHKHRLAEAFGAVASGEGRVSLDVWARVMKDELKLPIDWRAIQPSLVQTVKRARKLPDGTLSMSDTGLIDCNRFLKQFAVMHAKAANVTPRGGGGGSGDGMSGGSSSSSETLEALYANHAELLTIFRFLDTDRNGRVSKEEWRVGVELLNRHLPPEQHLSVDADSLFAVLDLDGSGELELDEFSAAFTVVVAH